LQLRHRTECLNITLITRLLQYICKCLWSICAVPCTVQFAARTSQKTRQQTHVFSIKSECPYLNQFRNVWLSSQRFSPSTSHVFLPDLHLFITSGYLLKSALHPLFVLFSLPCYLILLLFFLTPFLLQSLFSMFICYTVLYLLSLHLVYHILCKNNSSLTFPTNFSRFILLIILVHSTVCYKC
jgi:hypothetical protein